MKKPEIPSDETARLNTLRSLNVLDIIPEERFDRVTRLAKKLFDVPIALVSIVDENRQWFKSCMGLSVSETARDISFCGHAILGNEVFIIPDASEDDRFADNPLVVKDPKIRFYAGCPLQVQGQKLGTLCIIDRKPRSFEVEDIELLKDLALMVERELEAIQLATLDELTHISNRRGFLTLAQNSLNLCMRQNIPVALVFLDLDKFKPINDHFGHAEGDAALIAFANLMKESFRRSDVFARYGGDEFVVLFSNSSMKQAEFIIEKFRLALQKYNVKAKRGYDISFSYGVVEFDHKKHAKIEDLISAGDEVMYQIKSAKN